MYDANLYKYDPSRQSYDAALLQGAYLFRITSLTHNEFNDILAGQGPIHNRCEGRFHGPMQPTTYCANNVLVCISEVLFHAYRSAIDAIKERRHRKEIRALMEQTRCLTITRLKQEIANIVNIDAKDVTEYDNRLCGATCVFPDPSYDMFREFSDRLRKEHRKGILYPSARHSRDICVALFDDETETLDHHCFERLDIKLRLLTEEQETGAPIKQIDPFEDKLHPTMGYYEFLQPTEVARVRSTNCFYPLDIPDRGLLDFVRRRYRNYPVEAVN